MWGSLSLGSIRDAANKIKDGLEAQMEEAVQQSGPKVARANASSLMETRSNAYGASSSAHDGGLSPLAKAPGLQLATERSGSGWSDRGTDRANDDMQDRLSPTASSPLPHNLEDRSLDAASSPGGNGLGRNSVGAAARERRDRHRQRRALKKDSNASSSGASQERPRVQRLPATPKASQAMSPRSPTSPGLPGEWAPEDELHRSSLGAAGDAFQPPPEGGRMGSMLREAGQGLHAETSIAVGGGAEGWGDIALDSDDEDLDTVGDGAVHPEPPSEGGVAPGWNVSDEETNRQERRPCTDSPAAREPEQSQEAEGDKRASQAAQKSRANDSHESYSADSTAGAPNGLGVRSEDRPPDGWGGGESSLNGGEGSALVAQGLEGRGEHETCDGGDEAHDSSSPPQSGGFWTGAGDGEGAGGGLDVAQPVVAAPAVSATGHARQEAMPDAIDGHEELSGDDSGAEKSTITSLTPDADSRGDGISRGPIERAGVSAEVPVGDPSWTSESPPEVASEANDTASAATAEGTEGTPSPGASSAGALRAGETLVETVTAVATAADGSLDAYDGGGGNSIGAEETAPMRQQQEQDQPTAVAAALDNEAPQQQDAAASAAEATVITASEEENDSSHEHDEHGSQPEHTWRSQSREADAGQEEQELGAERSAQGSAGPDQGQATAGPSSDEDREPETRGEGGAGAPAGLAAELAAARDREDALTARLLMAEELLAERERQLETTNVSMAELMQNSGDGGEPSRSGAMGDEELAAAHDEHRQDVARLEGMLEAERRRCKAAIDDVKAWEKRAEEFQEKDSMLKAYMDEGAALAYKQSEMERTVRKARGELRGMQADRDNLAKEKQALEANLAGVREQLRVRDEELTSQNQSLAAMGAVSQASSQRLTTAEKELDKSREALSAKKAALDKSWAEIKELKRSIAELRADKDAMARSLEDGGKARQATESQLQEWQSREAALLLEQGQLQDTLERVRREADRRDDEAKSRQEDMRRRWKDAVARAEALQAEAHESTAPLLRQVRSLQEEMRLRQEAVRAAEASLAERAASAEQACRDADRRRRAAEAHAAEAQESLHRAEGQIETMEFKMGRLEASFAESTEKSDQLQQRVIELEAALSSARESAKAAAQTHKAMEGKLRLQVEEVEDRLEEALRMSDNERRNAKDTITTLKERIEELRRGQGTSVRSPGGRDPRSSLDAVKTAPGLSGAGGGIIGGSGGATFAEVERLQSLARQREGHAAVLQQRLEEIQATRDTLTEEVTALGRRNTELEALAKAVPRLRDQALELQQKNGVLLDLLGEKSEELEAAQSDMKEVQNMYRAQYDELLSRTPLSANAS